MLWRRRAARQRLGPRTRRPWPGGDIRKPPPRGRRP